MMAVGWRMPYSRTALSTAASSANGCVYAMYLFPAGSNSPLVKGGRFSFVEDGNGSFRTTNKNHAVAHKYYDVAGEKKRCHVQRLRRRINASKPRPNNPIDAGSGTVLIWMSSAYMALPPGA